MNFSDLPHRLLYDVMYRNLEKQMLINTLTIRYQFQIKLMIDISKISRDNLDDLFHELDMWKFYIEYSSYTKVLKYKLDHL